MTTTMRRITTDNQKAMVSIKVANAFMTGTIFYLKDMQCGDGIDKAIVSGLQGEFDKVSSPNVTPLYLEEQMNLVLNSVNCLPNTVAFPIVLYPDYLSVMMAASDNIESLSVNAHFNFIMLAGHPEDARNFLGRTFAFPATLDLVKYKDNVRSVPGVKEKGLRMS